MKIILTLFLTCAALCADSKTEAELRSQLVAAQTAAAAAEARAKRLMEAVAVQAETSKQNSAKIDEVKGKIDAAQVTDHKLVETVQTQAVETQKAAKKLADVVSVQGSATVSALSNQMREQERNAQSDARAIAKDLKLAKAALEKASEDRKVSEREQAAAIAELSRKADVLADKRDARDKGYDFWWKVITALFVPIVGAVVGYLAVLQKSTHTMVNGQRTAMELRIRELEEREKAHQILEALHTTPPSERHSKKPDENSGRFNDRMDL